MTVDPELDRSVPPSGTGCVECLAGGGWWLHLRRCVRCGHIGCCDSSPSTHASKHAHSAGHPLVQSFEPGEDWFWDYRTARTGMGRRGRRLTAIRQPSRFRVPRVGFHPTGSDSSTEPAGASLTFG